MPVGKAWSRGNGKPLMTLQQLAHEVGTRIEVVRARIRLDPNRPKKMNKSGSNAPEHSSYYDKATLLAWWASLQAKENDRE